MYTVNNKFEIGEECYTVVRELIKCECPVCKCDGKFTYNGYEIKCKQCNGTGKIDTNQSILTPCKVRVKRIKVAIWKDAFSIKYGVNCIDNVLRNVNNRQESSLFKTIEEAEKHCMAVNSGQTTSAF